jgi:hypothetical protein
MKFSEFVGLGNVSIVVDLKSFKTLQRGPNRGDNLGSPSQNLIFGISPF